MRKRIGILWAAVIFMGLFCLGGEAADKPIITITAENQSLSYGQAPAQGRAEITFPDSMNQNWYTVSYTLTADYANRKILVSDVAIIYDGWQNVTTKYQIETVCGKLNIRQIKLSAPDALAASAIVYGQSLSSSMVTGQLGYTSGGSFHAVAGSWTWAKPTAQPTMSGDTWYAAYTVTDAALANYFYADKATLSVAVEPAVPHIVITAPDVVMSGGTVEFAVRAENPYASELAAPTPTVTYKIGNGAVKTVQGSSFSVPVNTPNGTVITITASTAEDWKKYEPATASVSLTVKQVSFADAVVTLGQTCFSYDGMPKEPAVRVSLKGADLIEGVDYRVSYADNTMVGTGASVTVTGMGQYSGTITKYFTIEKAQLTVTAQDQALIYGQKPDQSLFDVAFPVAMADGRYTVTCVLTADPVQMQIAVREVKVTCNGVDVTDEFSVICVDGTLRIRQSTPICADLPGASAIRYGEALSSSCITGEIGYRDENGAFVPLVGVWSWDRPSLCPDISGDAQRAYFTVTDPALQQYFLHYSADLPVVLTAVTPTLVLSAPDEALSGETVTVSVSAANPINGDKVGPEVVILYQIGGGAWQTAVGCRIPIPAGTPDGTCVSIIARTVGSAGQYAEASANAALTVRQISFASASITADPMEFAYDGSAKTPVVRVVLDGKVLERDVDYTVVYADNLAVGSGSATAVGIGRYMGQVGTTFTIRPGTPSYTLPVLADAVVGQTLGAVDLPAGWHWAEPAAVLSVIGKSSHQAVYTPDDTNYAQVTVSLTVNVCAKSYSVSFDPDVFVYQGREQRPEITVLDGVTALTEGLDYRIEWPADCINAGVKTFSVVGLGMYAGTVSRDYTIARADANAGDFSLLFDGNDAVYSGTAKQVTVEPSTAYSGYGQIIVTCRRTDSGEVAVPVDAGTYSVLITMTEGQNFNAVPIPMEIGTITIRKAPPPAAPAVDGQAVLENGGYSYTLFAIVGGEYKMDDGAWQSDPVFLGIAAGSTHTFSVREAGNANVEPGEIGVRTVTFDRISGSVGVEIVGWTYGQPANAPVPVSATHGTANVTYLYKLADASDETYAPAVPASAGRYTVKAIFPETAQYTEASAEADFTIAPTSVTVVSVVAEGRKYEPENAAVRVIAVALKGILPADSGAIKVDCSVLLGTLHSENAGEYRTLRLPALVLIGAGRENYTLIQPAGEVPTAVTITRADGPAAPAISGTPMQTRDTFTYTLCTVDGGEYRIDDGNWQESPVFAGIAAGSTHTFSARRKATENYLAGAISRLTVTFDRAAGRASVSLADWCYGDAPNLPVPVSDTNGTADVSYRYKVAGADDSSYTTQVPTAAGRYTVQAVFPGNNRYFAVVATADFSIARAVIPQVSPMVAVPVAGALPQASVAAEPGWTGTICWTPADGCFAYDTVYTATIVLEADDNHCFAASTAAEGFVVAQAEAGRLILHRTFAATQKAAGQTLPSAPRKIVFDGSSIDVSDLFVLAANAEHAVYTIAGGTGAGSLIGNQLTVTRTGSFEIAVYLPAMGAYAEFRATAQLTVVQGESPAVLVGLPMPDAHVQVGDVLRPAVDGADGRSVNWHVIGPALAEDGVITVTGAGEITVTATLAADALYAEQTLSVTFTAEEKPVAKLILPTAVTMLVRAGEGGKISRAGRNLVMYGASHTFRIIPDAGYQIDDVRVNGVSVGAVDSITLRAKQSVIRLEASFIPIPVLPFSDVTEADACYDAVKYVWENGIMDGVSESSFGGTETVSRGMFVGVLWQMEGCPTVECPLDLFDVSQDQPNAEAIRWAAAVGLLNGYGNGLFGPDDSLTHAQAAAILTRYSAYRGLATAPFAPSEEAGIVNRAACAEYLYRLLAGTE